MTSKGFANGKKRGRGQAQPVQNDKEQFVLV
jgi:hypothetical protein